MPTMTEQQVKAKVHGIDVGQIQSIETASGWRNVSNCEKVYSAIGEAQSPLEPAALKEALRYRTEDGRSVVTPLKHVLSTSFDKSSEGFAATRR